MSNVWQPLAWWQRKTQPKQRTVRTYWLWMLALLLTLQGGFQSEPARAVPSRDALNRALKATVIVLVPNDSGQLNDSGSGTVLNAQEGLVLTNFHVMGDNEKGRLYNNDGMAVLGMMPPDMKGAPVLKYVAQMIEGDPEMDLALLKIVALYDNQRAPLPSNLGLTEIPLGDSDQLQIGDEVNVFGYPGIGGGTVTFTEGKVSGFLDDDSNKEYEWIKTDAEVNHGNSGGLATNAAGEFIGVPSAGVSDPQAAGKISLIRSGAIALRFYESVLMKQGVKSNRRGAAGGPAVAVQSEAQVFNVAFGTSINRQGKVDRPGVRFASGITDLYAAFSYNGFSDGQNFSYIWYQNGEEVYRDNFDWQDGRAGNNWVNISRERGLTDGFYEVELQLDGVTLFRQGISVGIDKPSKPGSFGEITFAASVDPSSRPVDPAESFSDVTSVYAAFPVTGMQDGTVWSSRWFYEGEAVSTDEMAWDLGNAKNHFVWLEHPQGLPVGRYKLELYIEGRLQQSAEFEVTERPKQQDNGVMVTGTISDADNKRRMIDGALVIFLNPGTAVQAWIDANYDEAIIYAQGTTNRQGAYQLDKKVIPGQAYGVVVYHEQYELVSQDAYEIPTDTEGSYTLDANLQQR